MPICKLDDLPSLLRPNQTLLGIDNGAKQVGIALSDARLTLASAHSIVKRDKFSGLVQKLQSIIREWDVGAFIIGLPLELSGHFGPAAQAARTLGANLDKAFSLPIVFWDERFSTAAIQRELINVADMSRAKRSAVIDKLAAAYILQGAIDYINNKKSTSGKDFDS